MSANAHPIPELDSKGYRDFALTTGGIVAGLFGLFFPWLLDRPLPTWPLVNFGISTPLAWLSWPWIFFIVLSIWGLIAPMSLRPVYTGWMKFGLMLSKITTPIIMGIVFYAVFAPMGLVMRLFGKDSMARKLDESAATYRVESVKAPAKNLEKPF
jgi:predicted membrane metal-binding protein